MKRHIALVLFAAAVSMLAGCATVGSTRGIATPWAVAGTHSFGGERHSAEPSAREVDAQVAQALDDASFTDQRDALVAGR